VRDNELIKNYICKTSINKNIYVDNIKVDFKEEWVEDVECNLLV